MRFPHTELHAKEVEKREKGERKLHLMKSFKSEVLSHPEISIPLQSFFRHII